MKNIKKRFLTLALGASIVVIGLFGMSAKDSYFELSKNMEIFAHLFQELNIYYVDDTEPGKLMKTGIDAMLKSLDPYTVYYPEEEIEDYRFLTTGKYGGIGSLIRKQDEHIIIAEPYEGFPAEKAGLRAGDKILEVDGESAEGKSTSELSKLLKGQANSAVKLKVERFGKVLEKQLTREDIKLSDVPYFGMLDDKTGYIALNSFTQTAAAEVKKAYKSLSEDGMKNLIFDLRGNGGGLLQQAVEIVNFFVDKGQMVVSTKGKMSNWDREYKATNEPLDSEIPVIVLVDGSSASASEIVAGALQDLDRALVIGQKSFGKGLVQQSIPLSYNTKLKVTVAKYYIPSGRCIQKIDYAHKVDGKAAAIPDSLAAEFRTKNGRLIYDAGGISPDIPIEERKFSNIAKSLMAKSLVFDFASEYRNKVDSIPPAEDFEISDAIYDEFKEFLKGKDYAYKTDSERLLEELEEATKEEKYFDDVEEVYKTLEEKIFKTKEADLSTFSDEIRELLENEIISRYYYQKGRVESSLKYDSEVTRAVEIAKDLNQYYSLLSSDTTSIKN
jgi:carboxyl-terminal processing protease